MRKLLLLSIAGVSVLGLISCGSDSTSPNRLPVVSFLLRPDEGAAVGNVTQFVWTGTDADGTISGFEIALDADTLSATQDTSVVYNFTREDGTDSTPQTHTFRVRAIDDEGLAGAFKTASFLVTVFNERPAIQFTSRPATDEDIGEVAVIGWRSSDADGVVDHHEFVLDDTTAAWASTSDTTVTIDFSSGVPTFAGTAVGALVPLHNPILYTFHVRAVDDEGKTSITIRTPFIAGPVNVLPTIALLDSPPEPPGTVTSEGRWVWEAADPDGKVLRVQYGIDLTEPPEWVRWDADTLRLQFTRAHGTSEDPVLHTFSLRAQDDDSTFSPVVTRDFQVGVPNKPPTVAFTTEPPPNPVSHRFRYTWSATDDEAGVTFEYAVDDSLDGGQPAWTATAETEATINFSATGVDTNTCGPSGCNSFGEHTLFLRAIDAQGAHSQTLSSNIQTFSRTPFTLIDEPPADGEGVAVSADTLAVRWTSTDIDGGSPFTYEILAREVDDFAGFPDAGEAVNGAGATWLAVPAESGSETQLLLDGDKNYILAIRAADVAGAREAYFEYGRNVLKVAAP